jgi:hypothetical protein
MGILTAGTARPYAAFLVNDADGIFAGLFSRSGHDKLAQGVGEFSEEIFTSRIAALGQAVENKALIAQIASDPVRRVSTVGTWMHGRAASVPQARYGLAPLSVPLETGGLNTCSALCVVDRSRGLQYMAHADSTVLPSAISNQQLSGQAEHVGVRIVLGSGSTRYERHGGKRLSGTAYYSWCHRQIERGALEPRPVSGRGHASGIVVPATTVLRSGLCL